MISWRPNGVETDEVATIVIGGWLAGSVIFSIILSIVGIGWTVVHGELGVLLMLPQLLFLALFGAGLLSVVWVVPTGTLLVAALKIIGAGWRTGLLSCFGVGCVYAIGLSALPVEWQWWADFWYAGPIYGGAMGLIYARTTNA